jgi:hypothetical protein
MSRDDSLFTETVTHGRRTYTIKAYHDHDVESPIGNNGGNEDVFFTHRAARRSGYGNEACSEEMHEEIGKRIEAFHLGKAAALANALADGEEIGEPLIGLAVWVSEHGPQVSISTGTNYTWGEGQSGYIYVTQKTALEWQGVKRLTKRTTENMLNALRGIVEEYSRWCNGECYYYIVEDENGERIDDLGCGGYIGHDYMLESAKEEIAAHHKWRVKQACEKRMAAAKERIERLFWAARDVVTA